MSASLAIASTRLTAIGDDWRQFASACVRASRSKGEAPDFRPIAEMLRGIAGQERVLTSPTPDQGNDVSPRFSPDGATVAFLRGTQSSREVWTVTVAEGAEAANTGSPRGTSYGLAWLGPRGPLLVGADWFGQRALNRFDLVTRAGTMVGGRGARSS